MSVKELITEVPGRLLVDIAYEGCGNDCKYCYVDSRGKKQRLVSYLDTITLIRLISDIIDRKGFTIISFCPNTEPFKSQESTDRVLLLIEHLKEKNCCFQISTKEYLSNELLERINRAAFESPIFINISIPVIDDPNIEPGALNANDRFDNIKRIHRFGNLKCGLYIKPVLISTLRKAYRYVELIHEYKPDYVCTGAMFDVVIENMCTSTYIPEIATMILEKQANGLIEFNRLLEENVMAPVIYSSICIIYKTLNKKCELRLWEHDKLMCKNCACMGIQIS